MYILRYCLYFPLRWSASFTNSKPSQTYFRKALFCRPHPRPESLGLLPKMSNNKAPRLLLHLWISSPPRPETFPKWIRKHRWPNTPSIKQNGRYSFRFYLLLHSSRSGAKNKAPMSPRRLFGHREVKRVGPEDTPGRKTERYEVFLPPRSGEDARGVYRFTRAVERGRRLLLALHLPLALLSLFSVFCSVGLFV